MYVLEEKKQLHILKMLVEGTSVSSTSRLTGVHRDTCTRLLLRFADACQEFLDTEMRDLQLGHLQIDELWTYCGKKARQVTGDEPNFDEIGEFYMFVALDEETRLIPVFRVDRRDEAATLRFMNQVAGCLKWPKPHESDSHAFKEGTFKPFIRISTDAFPAYRGVIRSVFGPYAEYGQIVKTPVGKTVSVTKRVLAYDVDPKDITTSLVERSNLTSRTFMRRLARRTLGFSKKLANLRAATTVHFTHYNYCWVLRTLKTTPAVAAGIAKERWKIADLYMHLRERYPHHFLGYEKDAA